MESWNTSVAGVTSASGIREVTASGAALGRPRRFSPLSELIFSQFVERSDRSKPKSRILRRSFCLILLNIDTFSGRCLCRARATYMPAEAGFGGCYVSIITLDIHKNNIKSNRDILQNHDTYLEKSIR